LDLDGAAGLGQLLAGSGSFSSLTKKVSFAETPEGVQNSVSVDVLVAGPSKGSPTELLDSGRMSSVLARIPESYDLVIVDTPPVGVVSDALPMLDLVDGVVIVGRLGVTTFESIKDLRGRLTTLDAHIVGVVVNGDVPNDQAYGYYQAIGSD
jgi:Mrp family chromosome partitioning ATPase